MKLIIIRSHLRDGLVAVERLTGSEGNLPVLKNILIDSQQGHIRLTATNLEAAATAIVPGKIIEPGKTTIPLSFFLSIINNLQTERLNIESKNDTTTLITDNYSATIQGLPASEFPIIPTIKNKSEYIEIKNEILCDAIERVVVATQFSDIHAELNSVFFNFTIDNLKLAGTDSFRLSERTITGTHVTVKNTSSFVLLLPLKTSHEVLRIFKGPGVVKMYHDKNQIAFESENAELISRLNEGNFPDYQAIIPKNFSTDITLNREEFIGAVKLTGIFGDKTSEVRVKIIENKKAIEIFSSSKNIGENTYVIPAKINGASKEILFNWKHLFDGLRSLKGEAVSLYISEDNKPVLVRSPISNDHIYVLMPIVK